MSIIIKHRNFLDVAFKIDKPIIKHPKKPGVFICRGMWLNQGFVDTYNIGIRQTIRIDISKKDWLKCLEPDARCIRNVEWTPIKL